jgi:hypothetical protein
MKYLICLAVTCLLVGCQCKKYLEPFSNLGCPVIATSDNFVVLHDWKKFRVGAIEQELSNKYEISDDSINTTIGIAFIDDDSTIIVKTGSMFSYAKNKYKVIKIFSKQAWVDGERKSLSSGIALQLLETPKYCKCQNKKLKAFDEQLKYMDIDSLLAE